MKNEPCIHYIFSDVEGIMAELPNIVGKLMASAPHAEWVTENPIIPKDVVLITADGYITVGDGTSTYTQLEQTYDPTARQEINDARTDAVGAKNHFDKWYLGPLLEDPELDNNGDTLEVGALYLNTVSKNMRFWDGDLWQNAYTSATQELSLGSYVISGLRETHVQPGCLLCNGAGVTLTYPDLRAKLIADGSPYGTDENGNPRLPKWGGYHIRGWLPDQLIDSGRVFGAEQSDAIRNITGTVTSTISNGNSYGIVNPNGRDTTGVFRPISTARTRGLGAEGTGNNASLGFDASLVVPTADENRPYNQTAIFWMKAYPAQTDTGNIDLAQITTDISAITVRVEALENSTGSGFVSAGPIDLAAKSQVIFGDIPEGTNTIKLIIANALPAADSTTRVTLGTSTGFTETGYVGTGANLGSDTTYNAYSVGFTLGGMHTTAQSGNVTLERVPGTNHWILDGRGAFSNTHLWNGGGRVELSAPLTQLRFSRASGSFTSGSVSIRRSN